MPAGRGQASGRCRRGPSVVPSETEAEPHTAVGADRRRRRRADARRGVDELVHHRSCRVAKLDDAMPGCDEPGEPPHELNQPLEALHADGTLGHERAPRQNPTARRDPVREPRSLPSTTSEPPKVSGQAPGCSNTAGATQLYILNDTSPVEDLQLQCCHMGRMVDLDDLLDAAGVADLLGLSKPTAVSVYQRRYDDFPEPVLASSAGTCQFWHRAEIEAWSDGRRRANR